MAEDGKIVYRVVINSDGVVDEVQNVGSSAGSALQKSASEHGGAFKEIMTGAARQIGAAFVNMAGQAIGAVTDTVKAALSSVASLEQNIGGVETLFKDSASTVIENAQKAYETAGLSANQYMETVTSFSASLLQSLGGDTAKAAEYADMAITDMSDNANKMGTDMQSIQNAYQGFAKQNYTMLDNLKLGYGGTKSEMERLVSDAEKLSETFTAQRDENGKLALSYSDVVDAIHIVQDNMGITGTTAREASETIEGSMNAAKAAWDNFLNGSGDAEQFADAVVTAATNIGTNVAEIAGRLVEELPVLFQSLVSAVPEIYESIMSAIAQESPEFAAKLDDFMRPMGEILKSLIDLGETVWPIVEPVIDLALVGLQNIAEILQEVVGWAQQAVDWLIQVGDWLDSHTTEVTGFEDYGFGANDYGYGNNASGTDNWRGGYTWVGEGGPELMKLPRGTQILSSQRSKQIADALNFDSAALANSVSYDMSSNRTMNASGATYYINVNGIDQLNEMLNWFESREIMGRMA